MPDLQGDGLQLDNEVREAILLKVNSSLGITGTELVLWLLGKFYNAPGHYLRKMPAIMSAEGELVEIEYIMPGRPSQSLFLPKGTNVVGVK